MKVEELLAQDLNEGVLKNAIAAAIMVVGALSATTANAPRNPHPVAAQQKKPVNLMMLVSKAAEKHHVKDDVVKQVVQAALKYEKSDFPKAKDILAVIGVESSFNPDAKSKLKTDPARGLMQLRPGVWKLPKSEFKTIDAQVKNGAEILSAYYKKLGSREAALHAYNVGLTNHLKSKDNPKLANPRYVPKVNAERALYGDD